MRFGIRRLGMAVSLALQASLLTAQDIGPSDYFSSYDPAAMESAGESPERFVSMGSTAEATATAAAGCGTAPCSNDPCGTCNCPECQKKAEALKKAVATAYAPVFYNNNFAYINNPAYNDWYPGDYFKQIPVGDCWMVDLGGQYRVRYQGERNMRGLGLTGRDDDFVLHRTRLFANAKYSDWFRAYAEYIDAESNYENFPPRQIEVNRSDMLNLFADARVFDGDSGDLWFRAGRQELLYGSERLISPLDWANTRRTFDGLKFFYQGQDWNVDFFYTRPVIVDPIHFDNPSYDQEFFGAWGTYKAIQGHTFDTYAIQYNNAAGANNFQFTTLGGRWLGSQESWLWEAEGGVQFGENTNGSDHQAGFATGGVGYKWADRCWQPQLWCYYDWASGGDVLGAGNGFNHLFPLAHKYLGFMDLFGRSNIQSPNVQLMVQPRPKLKLLAWYYYLFLDTRADTPYNVNMTPFAPGSAPASRDLGHELDLLATINLNARMDVVFGYTHFWSGDYYALTPGLPFRGDADFFYTHFQWNF
jgi:Alginate export